MPVIVPIGPGGAPSSSGGRGGASQRGIPLGEPAGINVTRGITPSSVASTGLDVWGRTIAGQTPGSAPLHAIFNFSNMGAYAVGSLASGNYSGALRNLYTFGQGGPRRFLSEVLREQGKIPGGTRGALIGLGIDIATDPLTFATFGVGAARTPAVAAARSSGRAAVENLARQGRMLTLPQRAQISTQLARAYAEAPRTLNIGMRLPLINTLRRGRPLQVSLKLDRDGTGLGYALAKAGDYTMAGLGKIGLDEGVRRMVGGVFHQGGRATPKLRMVAQDMRRLVEVEERVLNKMIVDIRKETLRAEKRVKGGVPAFFKGDHTTIRGDRGWSLKAISFTLDNPEKYLKHLPQELRGPLRNWQKLRDALNSLERKAGIEKGQIKEYFPHILRDARSRRNFASVYGARTSAAQGADTPFFVHQRDKLPFLEDLVHDGRLHNYRPETNVARALQIRAHASVRARAKKAFDDAIANEYGVASPLKELPDHVPLLRELAEARKEGDRLLADSSVSRAEDVALQYRYAKEDLAAAERMDDAPAIRSAKRRMAVARKEYARIEGNRRATEATYGVSQLGPATYAEPGFKGVYLRKGSRMDTRKRRSNRKGPTGTPLEATPLGVSPEGRRRARLYFGDNGENLAVRNAALAEAESAPREVRIAAARVREAEAQVHRSKSSARAADQAEAEIALREAYAAEREARAAASYARQREARAKSLEQGMTIKEIEHKLGEVLEERGATAMLNKALELRAGRQVDQATWEMHKEMWVEMPQGLKYHEGVLLPPEIANSMESAYKIITPSIIQGDDMKEAFGFLYNFTSRWKALALLSLGYHIRNMIDDGFRAFLAGARNPATFAQAVRVMSRRGAVKINGQRYTADQMIGMMRSEGVIGTGFTRADISDRIDNIRRGRYALPGRGPLAQGGMWFGEKREDVTRAFLFMEMMKGGRSAEESAQITRWFLFDYGEVGAFVNSARKFLFPFITYTSKALPQSVKLAIQRPGLIGNLLEMGAASGSLNPVDRSMLPSWMEDSIVLPEIEFLSALMGANPGDPLLLDPTRVTGISTLSLLDPRPDRMGAAAATYFNPLFDATVTSLFNYDLFRHRGLYDDERRYQPASIQFLDRFLPIMGSGPKKDSYSKQEFPGYDPRLEALLQVLPIFGQTSRVTPDNRTDNWKGGLFRYLAGLPVTPFDRARASYFAEKFGDD